jgi:hypothetical protein
MRRVFDLDALRCPRCAGRMQLIATIDDPAVIQRILAHLGLLGRAGGSPAPVAPDRGRSRAAGTPRRGRLGGVGVRVTAEVCPAGA